MEDDVTRETTAERRIAPRVDARLPLQLTEPDTRLVVTTESVDLSRNGIACRTAEYLAPLSKVAVTVILPPFGNLSRASRSLRAEGVVVRCEQAGQANGAETDREYNLACCFTALEPDARNLLDAFVAWRLLRSVRSEEPRASSHGAGGMGHGRSAVRGRFGTRPRQGGARQGGARHSSSGFRGPRGGQGSREGARHERGQGYDTRRSGEGRGERGRPRHGRPDREASRRGPGQGRPRGERPYGERSHGDRPHGERGHGGERGERGHRGHAGGSREGQSRESGPRDRPRRGRFRNDRRRQGGEGRGDRGPRGRGPHGPRREGGTRERPRYDEASSETRELRQRTHEGQEREASGRGEREEKRAGWGRRPSRRTNPRGRGDDSEPRRR